MKKRIVIVVISLLVVGCFTNTIPLDQTSQTPNNTESPQWQELENGLWQSSDGELALKELIAGPRLEDDYKYVYNNLCGEQPIRDVIDLATFRYLGSSFYKDKNYVYTHYARAYGGQFFIIKGADVETFEVIGDWYAKDKHHIYDERKFILDSVDYDSFKTKKGIGCYAKDKNNYYFSGEERFKVEEKDDYLRKLKQSNWQRYKIEKRVIEELDKL